MAYYYLSNPYQGSDAEKQSRADMAARVCFALLREGIPVFSPIVHNHTLMQQAGHLSVEERRRIFLTFDFKMLHEAKAMIVLTLEGWEASHGVQAEIEYCKKHNIPVHYHEAENLLASPALQ